MQGTQAQAAPPPPPPPPQETSYPQPQQGWQPPGPLGGLPQQQQIQYNWFFSNNSIQAVGIISQQIQNGLDKDDVLSNAAHSLYAHLVRVWRDPYVLRNLRNSFQKKTGSTLIPGKISKPLSIDSRPSISRLNIDFGKGSMIFNLVKFIYEVSIEQRSISDKIRSIIISVLNGSSENFTNSLSEIETILNSVKDRNESSPDKMNLYNMVRQYTSYFDYKKGFRGQRDTTAGDIGYPYRRNITSVKDYSHICVPRNVFGNQNVNLLDAHNKSAKKSSIKRTEREISSARTLFELLSEISELKKQMDEVKNQLWDYIIRQGTIYEQQFKETFNNLIDQMEQMHSLWFTAKEMAQSGSTSMCINEDVDSSEDDEELESAQAQQPAQQSAPQTQQAQQQPAQQTQQTPQQTQAAP